MEAIRVRGRVGADGILRLEVQLNIINQSVEAVIVVTPSTDLPTHDANGYPLDFFERLDQMAGMALPERAEQGSQAERDSLL